MKITDKERVKNIYPESHLLIYGNRIEIWEDRKFFSSCLAVLSLDVYSSCHDLEEKAWSQAWKQIKRDLIKKLEG
jgi:hypothetical protein